MLLLCLSYWVPLFVVYAKNTEFGAMAGAMLMPIVTLAQNRAAKILVNVAAVSVILFSFQLLISPTLHKACQLYKIQYKQ